MNQKIKIYYVLGPLNYGGAERMLVDLIKNLDKKIFLPKVFCLREKGTLAQELINSGIEVVVIPKKNKLGFDTLKILTKIFKQEKPIIIHTHLFIGDTWGRLAAIFARVPTIFSTEHNINHDENIFKRLIKLILSLFTHKIFAVSQAVKDYSHKKDGINAQKIKVIYNGIDTAKFIQTEFNFNHKNPIISCIGRLEEQKGQKYLILAMTEIIKKYPGARLWLVGNGSQQKNLKAQTDKLNLKNSVELLPATPDVKAILQKTDIFVLPSLWEGLGIVLLEALAALKPVVASRIAAVDEIIIDNQTGLLAEPKNSLDLANKIICLLENPNLAKELATNGQKMILENFNLKKMTSLYAKEYLISYENLTNK
ncbi:MAG TPA: glycosyltransferase [bacterium]|nr:glycosyltransferase [bacterium]HPL95650.1 glycosyltransferase [bacterium]